MNIYYQTFVVVEVLSKNEHPAKDEELDTIRYMIEEGGWSGKITTTTYIRTPCQMLDRLKIHGEEPELFGLEDYEVK